MEGVTDTIFRNSFRKYYGGVEKYFTPFLSPNKTHKFSTKELKQIDPKTNDVATTIPQLMTNKSEHFIWALKQLIPLGYKEINFNLGCPSATVVTKKKGSGFLAFPTELDHFLYEVFEQLPSLASDVNISIKTRLGKDDADDFYEILDIYNKYPISELTIHPRIQTDFYKLSTRPEYFSYAYEHSKIPLVYNGDLNSYNDIEKCFSKYPDIKAVMLGRGLITRCDLAINFLSENAKNSFELTKFFNFQNELLESYKAEFSGDKPVLFRMKEYWSFWANNFPENEREIKKIKKSNSIEEYKANCALLSKR